MSLARIDSPQQPRLGRNYNSRLSDSLNVQSHRNGPKRRRRFGLRRWWVGYLFIAPWLFGFILFMAGPLLASVYISLLDYNMLGKPKFVGIENYQELFSNDPLFWKALANTAYYTFIAVPLGVGASLLIALLVNHKVYGINFFRTLYYLPAVTSGIAVAILWRWIFNGDFGLANIVLSSAGIRGPRWLADENWAMPALIIMSLWAAGGNRAVILLSGLQSIPTQLYEAAQIDGADRWTIFWRITIPMLSPHIFFVLVVGLIGSFQIFTQSYLITSGGPNNATLTMVLYLYRNAFQYFRMGYASALAWVLFVIILVFTLIQFGLAKRWVYYEAEGDTRR